MDLEISLCPLCMLENLVVWMQSISPRCGGSAMRMHNKQLMSLHNMANDQPIPVYHKTTQQRNGCYGTVVLRTIAFWILSSLPRREVNCPAATLAVNSSSQTRDSYMWYLCKESLKCSCQSRCLQRKLVHQMPLHATWQRNKQVPS